MKDKKFRALMKDIEDSISKSTSTNMCMECQFPVRRPNVGELSLDEDILCICTNPKCGLHYVVVEGGDMLILEPRKEVFNRIN